MVNSDKTKILHIFFLFLVLSMILFSNSTSYSSPTSELSGEEGEAHILSIVCSDSGLCLIFYYRSECRKYCEVCQTRNGPYVKAMYITPSGEIINASSSYKLSTTVNIMQGLSILEVQEENDNFRIIGYDMGLIYEIWWFKSNNSLLVKEKDAEYITYRDISYSLHQWPNVNKIMNYSFFKLDLSAPNGTTYYKLVNVGPSDFESVLIPLTSEQFSFPRAYLFDGNSSIFTFDFFFTPNQLFIRRIFLNGTFETYLTPDLGPSPNSYARKIIGRDGNLYLGVKNFHPYDEERQDPFNHSIYLVDIFSKKVLNYKFTSPDEWYDWDFFVDSNSYIHVILNSDSITRYLKFSPNQSLELQSELTVSEPGLDTLSRRSFASSQEKFILGGVKEDNRDAGIYLLDMDTGEVVLVNSSIFPFIPYPENVFSSFDFFVFIPSFLILIFFKKRSGKR